MCDTLAICVTLVSPFKNKGVHASIPSLTKSTKNCVHLTKKISNITTTIHIHTYTHTYTHTLLYSLATNKKCTKG